MAKGQKNLKAIFICAMTPVSDSQEIKNRSLVLGFSD